MDFTLTDEQQALADSVISFARRELNHGVVERDRDQVFDIDLWRKCGEIGLQGLPVPEEYGGSGLDALSTAVALEALGYACRDAGLVFSICAHLLACVVPIWKHGTEEQKIRYLPRLSNGDLIAVNAMTESGTGSDAFAMSTRATKRDGGFALTGTKIFSSNGPIADVALAYALTDPEKGHLGGVTAFLIERGTPGYTAGQTFHKMGLRTAPIGELVFDDCFVPADAVVGGVGRGSTVFTRSMEWERACLAACHVGTMQRLLEDGAEHARTRKQFGQPIGKYQAISHRLADMKIRLEASRLLTYRAAWGLDNSPRDSGLSASITKVFTSEALVTSAIDAVQILGGYGFMVEYEVERVLRDSVGSTLYSGTSEMQRNIVARWLGL